MTTTNTTPARSATANSAPARPWRAVIREVAGDRVDRIVFAAVAAVAGFGYSVLLPFDYTQRVSFVNWQYFGPRYAAFTVAFALGLAWVVMLQVHAMRRIARNATAGRPRRGGPAGVLAAVVSLLPSLLCCSPVVPTLVHPAASHRDDHLFLRHQTGLAAGRRAGAAGRQRPVVGPQACPRRLPGRRRLRGARRPRHRSYPGRGTGTAR